MYVCVYNIIIQEYSRTPFSTFYTTKHNTQVTLVTMVKQTYFNANRCYTLHHISANHRSPIPTEKAAIVRRIMNINVVVWFVCAEFQTLL